MSLKLKQITGSASGSILFISASYSVTEDFAKLNWNSLDSILTINGKVKITDGSESLGYVLTSDADGLATWTDQSMYEVPISGTQNGVNRVFTLAYAVSDSKTLFYMNGVLYDNTFYTIDGTTLTLNEAPGTGWELKLFTNIPGIDNTLNQFEIINNEITNINNQIQNINSNNFPNGGIIMWSGNIDSIPTGWALCNGNYVNGVATPDLRNRFIVGAGSDISTNKRYRTKGFDNLLDNQYNGQGGTVSVRLVTNNLPEHFHTVNQITGQTTNLGNAQLKFYDNNNDINTPSGVNFEFVTDENPNKVQLRNGGNSLYDAGHSHGFSIPAHSTQNNTTTNTAIDIRPLYYALAFIMKVPPSQPYDPELELGPE
jgi:microcystin-dependent protein